MTKSRKDNLVPERVRIRYEAIHDSIVRCTIDVVDSTLVGNAAELRVIRKAIVRKERPVHASETLVSRKIEMLDIRNVMDLQRSSFQAFSYEGRALDIEIHSELKVADGVLFDTKLSQESEIAFSPRPMVSGNAKEIVDPADAYDLFSNIKALSAGGRIATAGLLILGSIIVAINMLIGMHDQVVPASKVWYYGQRSSSGKSSSPFMKSLMGSGGIGFAIWWAIRKQLRGYMSFQLHGVPDRIFRGDAIPAASLVRGRSRVPLQNITVRVVACNIEKGQYVTGSGKSRRTRTFKEPVRAVVLYEKRIANIPQQTPIETYLTGSIEFEPMFRALYPPQHIARNHALEVYWEIQLLHDEYVDQELAGPVQCFAWQDFIAA